MMAPSACRLSAIALSVTFVLGACGIDNDKNPRALPSNDVPFGLLDRDSEREISGTTTETSIPLGAQPGLIFLVDNNERLFEVTVKVAAPGNVRQMIEILFDDMDPTQLAGGLNTSIDTDTRLIDVEGPSSSGLVTLDVSGELATTIRERLRLALAQIVYTATAVPGVRSVRFKVDGELTDVPDETGAATSRPLTRADFAKLAPLRTTSPTPGSP